MKPQAIFIVLSTLVFAGLSGCSKPEEPAPVAPSADVQRPAAKAPDTIQPPAADVKASADAAAAKVQEQASAAQTTVVKAATDAQAQTANTSAQVQGLIDKARQYIADKNWSDALKTLTDLSALKLTPDQQKVVDSLKQQAEALAQSAATKSGTDAASKAASDLLKK